MPVSVADIVAQMRKALSLSEPDLDTTVGTPTRKILDAVGEVIAESYVDRYLLDYQYDIDTKGGADLDDFVALFGFTRFAAKRATGTITFERTTAATENILIPIGTQVATQAASPVIVATTVPGVMLVGDISISVPVQALVGGAAGNVPANSLRRQVTPVEGINSFTNLSALTGGADVESDEQLRTRFKRTVFRNLAGTEQMFLGIALDDPSVTQANVVSATERRREQVQIVGGTATSTFSGAKLVYKDSVFFGPDIDAGDIFTPDVHYTFTNSVPPVVTRLDAATVPDGVYQLEYEYVSKASRNDPVNGVTNRVDVYINGTRETLASEVNLFKTTRKFVASPATDPMLAANFLRDAGTAPVVGNYFIAFALSPVTNPSSGPLSADKIRINNVDYFRDVDYWLVNDITPNGLSSQSYSGIEFKAAANGQTKAIPPNNALINLEYLFNSVPRDVGNSARAWKLVTTDVRVHQAKEVRLNIHLAVILQPGYNSAAVRGDVAAALERHIASIGFAGIVQASDILGTAHRVPGVDAVRFLTSADHATTYAMQRMSATGTVLTTYQTSGRATDVVTADDEIPVFNDVFLTLKAQNTFGSM